MIWACIEACVRRHCFVVADEDLRVSAPARGAITMRCRWPPESSCGKRRANDVRQANQLHQFVSPSPTVRLTRKVSADDLQSGSSATIGGFPPRIRDREPSCGVLEG